MTYATYPTYGKRGIRAKRAHFSASSREREEKKERGESSFLPRSTEFRELVSIEPRTKVHRIYERYTWVPEKRDFSEVPRGEISGIQGCRV